MEPIMQMQDDIHKLKKMMDSVFEKMYVRLVALHLAHSLDRSLRLRGSFELR